MFLNPSSSSAFCRFKRPDFQAKRGRYNCGKILKQRRTKLEFFTKTRQETLSPFYL